MSTKPTSKKFLIALIAILILSAAGFAYYKLVYIPTPAQATSATIMPSETVQTSVVQQGDLTIYVRGTGTSIARDEINLGFGTGGPISELNVRIGDIVHKEDILAVQGNREKLEASVIADKISVLNATNALQYLHDNSAVVAAQAEIDRDNATVALNTAIRHRLVQQMGNRATSFTLATAKAALVLAQNDLDVAKAAYNAVSGLPVENPERAQAQTDLAAAQQAYNSALGAWNWYNGEPTEIDQALLNSAVALAEAQLALAQSKWEKVKDGPDPDQIALAELQLASAKANLAVSERNLEAAVIVAPMDGTILLVMARIGDDVSSPFISMADLSQRYLTISLDGADIGKIALDNKVEVIFDALPNQIFTGHVIQIDPNLYNPTGEKITAQTPGQITMVKGLVSLDESANRSINNLPLGMTATVNVISGQAKGVVLVPVEALHEQSPGRYAVFVMENGQQVLRHIDVGLMDPTYAEIKSGLNLGEIVVTSIVSSK
jgi:multidrug efflux pump subunit AcrA (membrane-fusion protein)